MFFSSYLFMMEYIKWYALLRDKKTKRFDLEISESPIYYEVKITSWEKAGNYSYISKKELDEYIVLEKEV
jgi:hypothetical protein